MLKEFASAGFAFMLPLALPVAWLELMFDQNARSGMKGGAIGRVVWMIIFFGSPVAGYAFIARPFGRWRDLDRRTWLFCVGLSTVYWVVYVPMLLWWLAVYAVGRAGGI
jgi:hypothetical protein